MKSHDDDDDDEGLKNIYFCVAAFESIDFSIKFALKKFIFSDMLVLVFVCLSFDI